MNAAEALVIVELVEVNWPRTDLADDTKQMWAETILSAEPRAAVEDGYEAIRDLAAHQTFAPALAEIIIGIRGARGARLQDQPAFQPGKRYTFAQFLSDYPEYATRLEAMAAKKTHKDNPIASTFAHLLSDEIETGKH